MNRQIRHVINRSFKLKQFVKYFASFDCDNCNKKISKPECKACHRMVNYFKIFDIPENYQVNINQISDKAKELQKQFHPDKTHNSSIQHEEYSSYINSARSTLSDDLKRADYLLSLRGINIDGQQSKINDSAFMIDMFELQEQIESISSEQGLKKMKERIQNILETVKGQINSMFEEEDNEKCIQFVTKYRYLFCALQNLKKKMSTNEQSL